MTPAVALDKVLTRWRAKLPAEYTPEFIDGFIQRNRAALEAVVEQAMMLRRVKQGEPPSNPDEFAIYGKLVQRERPRDLEPDDQVFKRILARREQMKARGRVTPEVAANHYIVERATAMLLRQSGWDAVPLLLREPALAVLVGVDLGAVVDVMGDLYLTAGFAEEERLRADLKAAHRRILDINTALAAMRDHRVVDRQPGLEVTSIQLERYALALWSRARESAFPATGDREQILATHRNLRDRYVNGEMPLSEYSRRLDDLRPGALAAGLTREEMGRLGIPFHPPEEIVEAIATTTSTTTTPAASPARASGRGKKRKREGMTPSMGAHQAGWTAAVEAFNAGPRWRLARRQGATTDTLVVFDEQEGENTPVAVFEVIGFDVDQERWTRSVGPLAEGEIRGRLERALWVASDIETASKAPRSPLEDLIAHIRKRGKKLGAASASELAEARKALAEPPSPDILVQWLRSADLSNTAESIIELFSREGDVASSLHSVESKMARVWDSASEELTLLSAETHDGALWVPDAAVHGLAEIGRDALVLEYSYDSDPARHGPSVFEVPVHIEQSVEDDDAAGWVVKERTGRLKPGARLYADDRSPGFYAELHQRLHQLEDDLTRAPRFLSDVRELLYWSAALIDAPHCQAETKRAAQGTLQSAISEYGRACLDLASGATIDHAAPVQEELRKLSEVAAGLALSCGEGQMELSELRDLAVHAPAGVEARAPAAQIDASHRRPNLPAGAKAVKWLHNILRDIRPVVNVGVHEYRDPVVGSHDDVVTVVYTDSRSQRTLTLTAMPLSGYAGRPHDGPVLLSGEIRSKAAVEASFSDIIVERTEIKAVTDKDLKKWFTAPGDEPPSTPTPGRTGSPKGTTQSRTAAGLSHRMVDALVALRHEENENPWEIHSWPGVHEATQQALIARGLVIVIDNKHGGFPHYRTTPAGRAFLAELGAEPVAQVPEERIGDDANDGALLDRFNAELVKALAERDTLDMTTAELLARVFPRWRTGLPPALTPFVEGFLRRQRGALEVIVQRELAAQRAAHGEFPDTIVDFSAYDSIARREREGESTDEVMAERLVKRITERVARGHELAAAVLAEFGDDYVSARTEALLLRFAGWDAIPLLLEKPALAVVIDGAVVAVRDTEGRLAIHPLQAAELIYLRADFEKAKIRTLYLRNAIDINRETPEGLAQFAMALWASAREPAPAGVATPRPQQGGGARLGRFPARQQMDGIDDSIARAREALTRAGIDPADLRVVRRIGECRISNATTRDRACGALRAAGIPASIIHDRLLFPLRQP